MRKINLDTWPRRKQYRLLKNFDYPHFNLCANVDITSFYSAVKRQSVSFTVAVIYILARGANEVPEFRCRIRGDEVVEHEIVHPSTTYLTEGELFSFCLMPYYEDFSEFASKAAEQIALLQESPSLEEGPVEDAVLYMTPIPWISFTGLMHPIHFSPIDSIPRFAWGKFFREGERLKMPLSVQAHHALMDGVHMGHYYEIVQDLLNQADSLLDQE